MLAVCRKLPAFSLFYVYWFVVAVIFMYGGALKDIILVRCARRQLVLLSLSFRKRILPAGARKRARPYAVLCGRELPPLLLRPVDYW